MSRVEENKQRKKTRLMENAFALFTSKGIAKTSVSDIVEKAGMAKGTFYLYFKDKYDLQEKLTIQHTERLFRHAVEHSGYAALPSADDRILAVTDDILYQLKDDTRLLRFISKNLSWSVFRRAIHRPDADHSDDIRSVLGCEPSAPVDLELQSFFVLELVCSTCCSVILEGDPVDLDHFLPYLHRSILAILNSFRTPAP